MGSSLLIFSKLLSIAEETLTEFFYSKATGIVIEWVQMHGMKPGPDSIGTVAISHGSTGVAARACGHMGLEPTRIHVHIRFRDLCEWHILEYSTILFYEILARIHHYQ